MRELLLTPLARLLTDTAAAGSDGGEGGSEEDKFRGDDDEENDESVDAEEDFDNRPGYTSVNEFCNNID